MPIKKIILGIAAFFLLSGICNAFQVTNVSVESKKDFDNIRIEMSSPAEPKLFELKDPGRIVIDIPGAFWDGGKRSQTADSDRISAIRWAQNSTKPDNFRVVVDIKDKAVEKDLLKENGGCTVILEIKDPGIAGAVLTAETTTRETYADTDNSTPVLPKEIAPSNIKLSVLNKFGRFSIAGEQGKFKLGKRPVFTGKTLFVPVKELFASLGFALGSSGAGRQFTAKLNDEAVAQFSLGSDIMVVNGAERKLSLPVKKVLGKVYIPFISAVKWLGYGAEWDKDKRILYINPRITRITWEDFEGNKSVVIYGSRNFTTFETEKSQNPKILAINVPQFFLDMKKNKVSINEEGIRGIKAVHPYPGLTKIGIYFSQRQAYRVKIQGSRMIVVFPPTITSIKTSEEAGDLKVQITSTRPVDPDIRQLSGPDRIVLDIPNAVFSAPMLVDIGRGGVVRVRADQFKLEPLVTRVIVDLQKPLNTEMSISDDNTFISIDIQKETLKMKKAKKLKVLKNKIIVVDPGHGGKDPGSFGFSGDKVKEKDLTLETSLRLQKLLSDAGAIVYLTREDDTTLDLQSRVDFAKNNNANLLICLHYNAFYTSGMAGTETYYYNPNSKLPASMIHSNMLELLGRQDKGLMVEKFFVIANCPMPSVLVEPLYISNQEEERLALDTEFRQKVAQSIFNGIKEYFEVLRKVE